MPKAHAAGIFNGLASNKRPLHKYCAVVFLRYNNKKRCLHAADSAKTQKGKRDRP